MPNCRIVVARSLFVVALCFLAGCDRSVETHEAESAVFRWKPWVTLLWLSGGIAAFLFGLYRYRRAARSEQMGWGGRHFRMGRGLMFMLGGIILCIVAPAMHFMNTVKVSHDGFVLDTGHWWSSSSVYSVRFADISKIEIISRQYQTRHSTHTEYFLVCHMKDGREESVPDDSLMHEGAEDKILETAQELGIPVEELTSYAVIAYSPATGEYGYTSECSTFEEAEKVAVSRCKAPDARLGVWARNQWCALAIAEDKTPGYGFATTKAVAERNALSQCRQRTKTPCRIAVSVNASPTSADTRAKEPAKAPSVKDPAAKDTK